MSQYMRYWEYIILDDKVMSHLLDLKEIKIKPLLDINKIIVDSRETMTPLMYHVNEFNSIDTNFVHNILVRLIKNNSSIVKYKRIFRAIFVEEDEHIFYDKSHKKHLMSEWVTDVSNHLDVPYKYISNLNFSKEDVMNLRFVKLLDPVNDKDKIIQKLKKYGVKHILILEKIDEKESMYDYNRYIDYILEYKLVSGCKDLDICDSETEYKKGNYDCIFSYKKLFYTHFLKYIVS